MAEKIESRADIQHIEVSGCVFVVDLSGWQVVDIPFVILSHFWISR